MYQARYREASAFRVLCFNDSVRWSHLTGVLCSLEAESTWRNVVSLVPSFLHPLSVFTRDCLPVLLAIRFALSPSMTFLPRSKTPDSFDLLSFAFESEKLVTVDLLLACRLRLVRFLGSVSGDLSFYESVFAELKVVLCPSSAPFSMSTWEPEFVFKWLSNKLFAMGVIFGSDKSEALSKVNLLSSFRAAVSFQYSAEQSQYLGSAEYQSRLSRLITVSAVVSAPGGSVSPAGRASVSTQWCMQHARFSLNLASVACPLGSACTRLHPFLVRPFSDSNKHSLRNLANIIKVPASRDLFLAAIN